MIKSNDKSKKMLLKLWIYIIELFSFKYIMTSPSSNFAVFAVVTVKFLLYFTCRRLYK
jgi:hypothetical protein